MVFKYLKLEIFIPESHLAVLQKTLQDVDAGHIGNYDSCLSYSKVTGTWRTLEGAEPYIGSVGEISREDELRVDVRIKSDRLEDTISAIKKIHPYEEPVIHIIPLISLEEYREREKDI